MAPKLIRKLAAAATALAAFALSSVAFAATGDEPKSEMNLILPDFSTVQFHPEASPGPLDALPFFDQVAEACRSARIFARS